MKFERRFAEGASFEQSLGAGNKSIYTIGYTTMPIEQWPIPATTAAAMEPQFDVPSSMSLSSVSCTRANLCIAVGAYDHRSQPFAAPVPNAALAQQWNGHEWEAQHVPSVSGATVTEFNGVSCVSATECVAVGAAEEGSGRLVPYAAVWRNGAWSAQSPPEPNEGGKNTRLLSVSCTSRTFCMAVGTRREERDATGEGYGRAFAEIWNGSSWALAEMPELSNWFSGLGGISCTSPNMCFAVGQYYHDGFLDLVERWNGTTWSQEAAPEAGSRQAGWGDVSCTTPESCTLVGNAELQPGLWASAVENWNGRGWTVQPTPGTTNAESSGLGSVSCAGEASCVAVGTSVNFYAKQRAETRSQTTMAAQAPAPPKGATQGTLSGTSCATSTSTACIAVGSYKGSEGTVLSLAEEWTGLEWKSQATPNPAGAAGSELHDVSCTGPSECTAVGSYKSSSGTTVTLAEGLGRSGWQIQSTPNPEGAQESKLSGVSCPSASSCYAAGYSKSSSGALAGLIESFNGEKWQIQQLPAPSGATTSKLLDIACATASSCMAVGSYTNASGETLSLAESYDGSQWHVQTTPNPTGKGAELDAVSCPAQGACTAIGSYTTAQGATEGLAEGYNGSEWQLQPFEAPAETAKTSLSGVSCAPLGACIAVGLATTAGGARTPLAELWSGYEWRPLDTPSLSGSEAAELLSISCSSVFACESVGVNTSSKAQIPLAEGLGAPGVGTKPGSNVANNAATLTGLVNPNQWETRYYFEYGETTAYGSTAPAASQQLTSETGAEEVQALAGGLKAGDTYHFRLVAENAGGTTRSEDQTVVASTPAITEVKPTTGPDTGGTRVTITGTGFTGITAVKFGQTEAQSFEVESESKITAVAPPGSGTVDITLSSPSVTSGTSAADEFTYISPAVTEVKPNSGPEAGGTQVTITGTDLGGVTGVNFGLTAAISFKVESETKITATSPAGAGTVDITVTAETGGSALSAADRFAYESTAPTVGSSFGEAGSGAGQLSTPQGVAVDSSGNVWVSERDNNRVDEFGPEGKFKLAFGWGVKDGKEEAEVCSEACRAGSRARGRDS